MFINTKEKMQLCMLSWLDPAKIYVAISPISEGRDGAFDMAEHDRDRAPSPSLESLMRRAELVELELLFDVASYPIDSGEGH
jgi:hypothetical protein